jgi:DNA-binding MarR family transcriptional regulator
VKTNGLSIAKVAFCSLFMLYLHYYKCCLSTKVEAMQVDAHNERALLTQNIRQLRQAIWRDMLFSTIQSFASVDFSIVHIATLYLLSEGGEPTIREVAEALQRSVSATSRLLDSLVSHDLVSRREDERDRRAKRVSITEKGQAVLRTFDVNRAEAQLEIMEYLSPEERTIVNQAMMLLAEAARRRAQHL